MTETRYDDLRALFVNCTLKRSPELSHTGGLIDLSAGIMRKHGVEVEVLRAVDHDIATGVWPDMTEHGWASDEWPALGVGRRLPVRLRQPGVPVTLEVDAARRQTPARMAGTRAGAPGQPRL